MPPDVAQNRTPAALLWRVLASLSLGGILMGTGCHNNPSANPDGGSGADQGTADGFAGLADCPGVQLGSDGTLDVNLRSIHVSGAVTQNGAVLPDSTSSRGSIVFVDKHTLSQASADLGTSGAGHYDLILAPGKYDVRFAANQSLCNRPTNLLPCVDGLLESAVALSASGALDLDLPTVLVQGSVTVNGAAIPATYQPSGGLSFHLQNGGAFSTVGGAGLASYRVVLLKGSYEVDLAAPQNCASGNPLPCISGPLKTGLSLTSDGQLNLDIPTAKVSGNVQVNGQPVASAHSGLGAVLFQLTGGGVAATDDTNPAGGLLPYQLTLLRGTYDVKYAPRNNDCTAGVPCIGGSLNKGVSLQSDGTLDVNIPAITVQGNVTINGQPVVDASESGSLLFRNADQGSVLTASTGPKKLSQYKLALLPSSYVVEYASQSAGCNNPAAKGPCVSGPLKSSMSLMSSGSLDVDIPSITVGGRISVKGSAVPAPALSQGHLVFQLSSGGNVATPDLNTYSLRLLPGNYAVSYGYLNRTCQMNAGVPCSSGVLKPNQSLSTSGTLDVDIPLVAVSGRVTLDGMPMPTITATRGQLEFVLGQSGVLTPNFGSSGAVSYSVSLLPGTYEILHVSDFSTCSPSTGSLPCIGQAVAGCM
jgi:hypothetical protein